MRHPMLPLLMLAAMGSPPMPEAGGIRTLIDRSPRSYGRPSTYVPPEMRIACPRCKAPAGKDCDRRTLGAHSYHRARVDAAGGAA